MMRRIYFVLFLLSAFKLVAQFVLVDESHKTSPFCDCVVVGECHRVAARFGGIFRPACHSSETAVIHPHLHQIIAVDGEVIQRHGHRNVVVGINSSFQHPLLIGAQS